jgi:hypothetical protein
MCSLRKPLVLDHRLSHQNDVAISSIAGYDIDEDMISMGHETAAFHPPQNQTWLGSFSAGCHLFIDATRRSNSSVAGNCTPGDYMEPTLVPSPSLA